jgi:uncharacterized protein (TIGR00730 family)
MTRTLTSVAVFCGSNKGHGGTYGEGAAALGRAIARRGMTLVYGGTHKGLMGVLADACIEARGRTHGIITRRLHGKGHLHERLHVHEIAETMRARKERMAELADAVIALPGGIGTLEEFMEAWTLNQLGETDKPAGLLDVDGYYQPFLAFVDSMIARGFLPEAHRHSIVVSPDPEALLDGLANLPPITTPKWMG